MEVCLHANAPTAPRVRRAIQQSTAPASAREFLNPKLSRSTLDRCLRRLLRQVPFCITRILTDNDKAFTDCFSATSESQPIDKHAFDRLYAKHHIDHRLSRPHLIPPRCPQLNGRAERFIGRIAEAFDITHCTSRDALETLLTHYTYPYNHHMPQNNTLDHRTSAQALRHWQQQQAELFVNG